MSSSKLFPPYRGEALGSLKRPRELLERRALLEKGDISQADIKPTEDKAISSIIEMQPEIIHCPLGARRVQLPGAIMASDSWKKLVLDIIWISWGVLCRDWLAGCTIYGFISHYSFKIVIWMLLVEIGKAGFKPVWTGLCSNVNSHG